MQRTFSGYFLTEIIAFWFKVYLILFLGIELTIGLQWFWYSWELGAQPMVLAGLWLAELTQDRRQEQKKIN